MPLLLDKEEMEEDTLSQEGGQQRNKKRAATGGSTAGRKEQKDDLDKDKKKEMKKDVQDLRSGNKRVLIVLTKQILRSAQTDRELWGAVVDTGIVDTTSPLVVCSSEQTVLYNDTVQAKGSGHGVGPPHIWAFGGQLSAMNKNKEILGERLWPLVHDICTYYGEMTIAQKCEVVKICRKDKMFDSKKTRLTVVITDKAIRDVFLQCWDKMLVSRKWGKAPPTYLEREIQNWLEALMS